MGTLADVADPETPKYEMLTPFQLPNTEYTQQQPCTHTDTKQHSPPEDGGHRRLHPSFGHRHFNMYPRRATICTPELTVTVTKTRRGEGMRDRVRGKDQLQSGQPIRQQMLEEFVAWNPEGRAEEGAGRRYSLAVINTARGKEVRCPRGDTSW
ncbi:hypothetical protein Bbelb_296170 [Branchiostoma belcheri]|nr:hypothetical protein Bbelb_296170 [Branchiostoma belcheri]